MMRRPGMVQRTGPVYALGMLCLLIGGSVLALEPPALVSAFATLVLALGLSASLLALLHDLSRL